MVEDRAIPSYAGCQWLVLVLLSQLVLVIAIAAPVNLYVATNGSDANSGTLAAPFQTIDRARLEVRALKALAINQGRPINVFLRAGRYSLAQTLEFTPEDSGFSAQAPVTYQAYCDPAVEASAISVLQFPYVDKGKTPPRLLWNGVGDKSAWPGPVDPFAEMGVNFTNNSLLAAPLTPRVIAATDIGNVCVDKNGLGHTCYADGPLATCVSGCMTSCASRLDRKTYSDVFYAQFSHLFGKDLRKEEDCVEICTLSCRNCERVEISGAKQITSATWSLYQTITATVNGVQQTLKIFQTDLTALVPAAVAVTPTFTSLFLNGTQLPRAGFPNCLVKQANDSFNQRAFNCSYSPVVKLEQPGHTLTYNSTTFSSRVSNWVSAQGVQVEVLPNASQPGNLLYSMASVDATLKQIVLSAGGSQLSYDLFDHGPSVSIANVAAFRVENVLAELDSPGEWFFDESTRRLYLIPLTTATMSVAALTSAVIEIPILQQIVRVSGSRENTVLEAAHASSSLIETNSSILAANLSFRHLTFSGTQLRYTDLYERIPSSAWPMTRIAAFFIETVANILIQHCTFEKIGGNALMISGESDNVTILNNNVSFLGSNGISVLARRGFRRNSFQTPVLNHLLYSRNANISFNQVHHFGQQVAHSAAIMVVGARQTSIHGNLIYAFPTANVTSKAPAGSPYYIENARGATYETAAPLIRPITVQPIATTLAQNLSLQYVVSVPVLGFDVPIVAKLVGAPECATGTGRVESLYGEQLPYTYTKCSGCCSVHNNYAQIRVAGAGATPWVSATSRQVTINPGDVLELAATSSAYFNSIIDVYLAFHIVTPNRIVDLRVNTDQTSVKWQILTRKCQYTEHLYQQTCGGPCTSGGACGNSNMAIQTNGVAMTCRDGFEPDLPSLVCSGPFDQNKDCDGSGMAASHLYYNCSMQCFATSCT